MLDAIVDVISFLHFFQGKRIWLAWLMAWLKMKYLETQKERGIDVQSKEKLIVWLMTHQGKEK
jgi:hypothetical protein